MPCTIEICVIFAQPTYYLEEQLQALKNLSDRDFRVLYVPDEEFSMGSKKKLALDERFRVIPSGKFPIPVKRNFCLKNLHPETDWVAFIDDDTFPPPAWMENLKTRIKNSPDVKILGGPGLLPPRAALRERVIGLAVESYVGFGRKSRWSRAIFKAT